MKKLTFAASISLVIWVLNPSPTAAGEVELAQTGQTHCFDVEGAIIACGGTGQDGELAAGVPWPSPRFMPTGVGALTDLLTGLVWLSDANCMASNYPGIDEDTSGGDPSGLGDGLVTWDHCLRFLEGVNDRTFVGCAAGYADWRLPNVNELETLIHADTSDEDWLEAQGFSNVSGVGYWSSSTHRNFLPDNGWFVAIPSGQVTNTDKSDLGACLPVRGGQVDGEPDPLFAANVAKTGQTITYATGDDGDLQVGVSWPAPRFVDHEDGTVTDELSGLMWLKDANCIASTYGGVAEDGRVSWPAALDFVAGMNDGTYADCAAGHSDWRLPNRHELRSLTDHDPIGTGDALPAVHPFVGVYVGSGRGQWSSSTYVRNPAWAWYWDPRIGDIVGSPKTSLRQLWPVRTAAAPTEVPHLEVTPRTIDFGPVPITSGSFEPVSLSNTGDAPLVVSNMTTSASSRFPILIGVGQDACGSTRPSLAPGETCTVRVQFLPIRVEVSTATLTVRSNDPDAPAVTVALTGEGVPYPSGPQIVIRPPDHDFGTLPVGDRSPVQIFELRNHGDAVLEVSLFQDQAATEFPQNFEVGSQPCGPVPFSVGTGGMCTVGIAFAPERVGQREGWIQVHSNDPLHPSQRITLVGFGNPPDDEGGCGCRTAAPSRLGELGVWLAVLGLWAWRRRRARADEIG